MSFRGAAWVTRRARIAQEQWNSEHPEQFVPWEWLEEFLLAHRRAKECRSYALDEAREAQARRNEFIVKLPAALVTQIFTDPDQ